MDTLLLGLRVLLSLAAVLALLWLLQKRLTKRPRARSGASVAVVGRQSIGRRASAVVVEVDGTRLLLGVTEQSVTVLHSLGPVEADAAALVQSVQTERVQIQSAPADFAHTLSTAVGTQETTPELVPMLRPRHNRSANRPAKSVLGNSILAPATWRQTGAALRHSR